VTQTQRGRLSALAMFFENRVFPLLFGYFAFVHINVLWGYRALIGSFFQTFWLDGLDRHDFNFGMFVTLRLLLIVLNAIFAFGLFTRARAHHDFEDWKEVVVPVFSSGYGFFASALMYSHARINFLLVPTGLVSLFNSAGIFVVALGTVISVAAAWNLRRSFSVYVESQPVVSRGLYAYVRHPLYMGHGMRMVGYCMMNGFLLYAVATVGGISLLVYRALLEERKLARTEPDYAAYCLRTPSLAPRLAAARAAGARARVASQPVGEPA
jgi:protein-S-isoprenylcysteine O-methyltransferase Ste14